MLDFGNHRRESRRRPGSCWISRGLFAGRPNCPIRGGGSKSQAPDIRCLTLGLPPAGPEGGGTVGYPAVPLASPPPLPDWQRRSQKASTGYPVLDFRLPCFSPDLAKETAGTQRLPGQARPGFEAPGGGSESQAPDIRCLTSGSLCGPPPCTGKRWMPSGCPGKPPPSFEIP